MPRHLISEAHEWISEIRSVPMYYRSLDGNHSQGNGPDGNSWKEDPVLLDSSLTLRRDMRGVALVGAQAKLKYYYSYRFFTNLVGRKL